MDETRVKTIAQQVYDSNMTSDQFAVGQTSFHTHNDIDSPALVHVTLTYAGRIDDPGVFLGTVSGAFTGGESSATLTASWKYPSGAYTTEFSNGDIISVNYTAGSTAITWGTALTVTGAFVGGETSATLTAPWTGNSEVLATRFSNGNIRNVGYTVSSTAISWTGGLGSAATTAIKADVVSSAATIHLIVVGVGAVASFLPRGWQFGQAGNGIYTVTHNLNTETYSVVASIVHSLGNYAIPDIYALPNETTFSWIDITNPPNNVATSFSFALTLVTNKTVGYPQYTLN